MSIWMTFFPSRNKIIPKIIYKNMTNTIESNYQKTITEDFERGVLVV